MQLTRLELAWLDRLELAWLELARLELAIGAGPIEAAMEQEQAYARTVAAAAVLRFNDGSQSIGFSRQREAADADGAALAAWNKLAALPEKTHDRPEPHRRPRPTAQQPGAARLARAFQ